MSTDPATPPHGPRAPDQPSGTRRPGLAGRVWQRINKPILKTTPKLDRLAGNFVLLLEVAAIATLWGLLHYYGDTLRDLRNLDPYASLTLSVSGTTDMTYDRTLPTGQKIRINNRHAMFTADAPEDDKFADHLFPTFAAANAFAEARHLPLMPSVSMIHFWLSQHDEELLYDSEKLLNSQCTDLLRQIDNALAECDEQTSSNLAARAFVRAAMKLGNQDMTTASTQLENDVTLLITQFESGSRSALRGFNDSQIPSYWKHGTVGATLFRAQRFLMGEIPTPALTALIDILNQHPEFRESLQQINDMITVLNNGAETDHLLRHAAGARNAPIPPLAGIAGITFLPPALSPENAYYYKRFGQTPPSEGTQWMTEIVSGIRSGQMNTDITTASGWYDYKLNALVPLIRTDHSWTLSTRKLRATPDYRGFMEDTFRSALTSQRATHVLRIEPVYFGILLDGPVDIELSPLFSCEPDPTVYYRLSRGYSFLCDRLESSTLAASAGQLRDVTLNLAALSLLELGIPPDGVIAGRLPAGFPQSRTSLAQDWLNRLRTDPLLGKDPRLTVNVAGPIQWGLIGVQLRRLDYTYDSIPAIEGHGVIKKPASYYAPVLVAAELPAPAPDNFTGFCDKFNSVNKCLAALHAAPGRRPFDRITLEEILKVITALAGLQIGYVLIRRRWPRPPNPRRLSFLARVRRVFVALLLLVLVGIPAVIIGFPMFLLHVVPRIDFSPFLVREYTMHFTSLWCDNLDRLFGLDHMITGWPHDYYGPGAVLKDKAISSALRSENRSVRENALNFWIAAPEFGPEVYDTLLSLALQRDFDEAELALMFFNGNCSWSMDRADSAMWPIKQIFKRFEWNPRMVLYGAGIIRLAGDQDMHHNLEKAVIQASPSDKSLPEAVCTLLAITPERMPMTAWQTSDLSHVQQTSFPPRPFHPTKSSKASACGSMKSQTAWTTT